MSTKKRLRRERRQHERESRSGQKLNPVAMFMVGVVAVLILVGVVGLALRQDRVPPWPGAVWSEAHGHWH